LFKEYYKYTPTLTDGYKHGYVFSIHTRNTRNTSRHVLLKLI